MYVWLWLIFSLFVDSSGCLEGEKEKVVPVAPFGGALKVKGEGRSAQLPFQLTLALGGLVSLLTVTHGGPLRRWKVQRLVPDLLLAFTLFAPRYGPFLSPFYPFSSSFARNVFLPFSL